MITNQKMIKLSVMVVLGLVVSLSGCLQLGEKRPRLTEEQKQELANLLNQITDVAKECLDSLTLQTKTRITASMTKLINDMKKFYSDPTENNKKQVLADIEDLRPLAEQAIDELSRSKTCQEIFEDIVDTLEELEEKIEEFIP